MSYFHTTPTLTVTFEALAGALLKGQSSGPPAHGLLLGSIEESWDAVSIRDALPLVASISSKELDEFVHQWPISTEAPMATVGYYSVANAGTTDETAFAALPESIFLAVLVRLDEQGRLLAKMYTRDESGKFSVSPDGEIPVLVNAPKNSVLPLSFGAFAQAAASAPRSERFLNTWLELAVAAVAGSLLTLLCVLVSRPAPPLAAALRMAQPDPQMPRVAAPLPAVEERKLLVGPAALPYFREHPKSPILAETKHLPAPGFVLPTQPPNELQEPPSVSIWYAAPTNTSALLASTPPESRGAMLVHPFLETSASK